jgi:hypothetical protein
VLLDAREQEHQQQPLPEAEDVGQVQQRDGGHERGTGQVGEHTGPLEAQPIHQRPAEHAARADPIPIAAPVRPVLTGLPVVTRTNQGTARWGDVVPH